MNHAVRLLISFLFSLSAYATCPDAPTSALECRGAKLVTNQSELDAYLQNFAENTTKGFIRGVRLRGNFSGTSQIIASPCKIIIDEDTTLNFSEELCLISKDKVIARRGLNLFGKDVTLKAPNRVIIQDNATIDLSGDLTLHSHGPTEESRAHIRHSANVKVNNLTLRGLYRSTLGKESTYEAQGKISIFSTGEERPTDEDISEWSTVWGDTTIQADEFEARALWRVKVGTRTAINASKITLDGQGCKIGRDATLTALEKQGRCLLPNRPVARFKISPKEASIGESILLDGSRSQNAAAGESFRWRIDMPNGERIDTRKVEGPTYEFTPTQAGEHTIELRVYDQDGFHDWKKRKLIVRGSELFSYYKFELEEEKLSLIYEGRTLSDDRSIVEAFYTAPDGSRIDVGRRVLGHVDVIDSFDATEPVDLKLTVVDDLGTREEFTHTIEPRSEFQRPVLNFETIEYAPNELVFFSNFMFDPYNQLSDFDGFTLDFGDESSVEINAESFSTTHLYSSEGQYPAKIYAGDYENQKEITVTGSPSSFEFPLADFKVDGASWAPGVRLYVDQTISPASPIQSYLWRLGDGTTAYGPEVLHFYNEGAYDVSLTVILDNGTSSTVTREVIIMQTAPNLVGTVDCYDIGDKKAECHVEALDKLSDLKTLNINFGDNPQSIESTTVSGQWAEHTFIHSYEETGNYTVTMQALTNRGEEFFTTTEVAIGENPSNLPPVAILGCYPVYQDVICYSDSSYDPDGYITNYEYDFGDGTVINTTDTEVFHRFENTGTFTINLTVTDNFGVTASYPETVVIEEKPNEFPVPQLSCVSTAPQSLTCEGRNSYDPDGSITKGSLTAVETGEVFETNDLSALQKTFIFSSGGLKTIVLEVTDNQGAVVPLQRDFETMVNVPPIVSFYCTSSSIGSLSCDGSNSTLGNAPSFVSFNWVINGKNYSGDTVEVTGLTEDQASVSLTVVDSLGQTSSKTDTYEIVQNMLPSGDFNCTSSGPQQLNCLANFSDVDGEVISYTWSVEGQQFSGNYFETTLDRGGEVSISLSVKDDFGSEVLQNKTVKVNENRVPVAVIKVDSESKIAPATFTLSAENSFDSDGSIVSYEWTIKGQKLSGDSISFDLDEAKKETVRLKVVDNLGYEGVSSIALVATNEIQNGIIVEKKSDDLLDATLKLSASKIKDIHGDDLSLEWTINGQTMGNSQTIELDTIEYSNLLVSLESTDIYGNSDLVSETVEFTEPELYFELANKNLKGIVGKNILVQSKGIDFSNENYTVTIRDVYGQNYDFEIIESSLFSLTNLQMQENELILEVTDGVNTFSRKFEILIMGNPVELSADPDFDFSSLILNNERVLDMSFDNYQNVKVTSYSLDSSEGRIISIQGQSVDSQVILSNLNENFSVEVIDAEILSLDGDDYLTNVDLSAFAFGGSYKSCNGLEAGFAATLLYIKNKVTGRDLKGIGFNIGNQRINVEDRATLLFGSYNSENNIFKYDKEAISSQSLEKIFVELGYTSGHPVTILSPQSFPPNIFSGPPSGFVIAGINNVYIKSSIALTPSYFLRALAHEREHLNQSESCQKVNKLKEAFPGGLLFSQRKLVTEGYAESAAWNVINHYDSYIDIKYSGFLKQNNSITDSINLEINGFSEDSQYNNDLYFNLSGLSYESFLDLMIENGTSILQTLENSRIVKGSIDFLTGLYESPDRYDTFSLVNASHNLNSGDVRVGSLGFGFIRISSTDLQEALQGIERDHIRLLIKENDKIEYKLLDNGGGTVSYDNTDDGDVVIQISNPTKDLYFAIANKSIEANSLKMELGPLCYKGGFTLEGHLCKPTCGEDEIYWDVRNTCVKCNEENNGSLDPETGICRYEPRNVTTTYSFTATYSKREATSLDAECSEYLANGSKSGSINMTYSVGVEWYCNDQEKDGTRSVETGRCDVNEKKIINYSKETINVDVTCN